MGERKGLVVDCGYCRVVAEVNLDHLSYNLQQIRKITNKHTEIMAVVKADGYGHGVVEIARVLLSNGADRLAVAIVDEAIQLRKAGFQAPILILGFTPEDQVKDIVKYNIIQTVFTYNMAKALSEEARRQGKSAMVHIKVDTGMGRIGFLPNEQSIDEIKRIYDLPNIYVEGMFTHFAAADEKEREYTDLQFRKFMDFDEMLKERDILIPLKHAANSAGVISFPEYHLDIVRPGIILYGLYPSREVDHSKISLKPVMSIRSHISYVKEVSKGESISYGRKYITPSPARIATIPVGYADGFSRLLSNKGEVLVQGQRAKICGRICMDQFMIDVTHIPDVKMGDEVVIFGQQGGSILPIEEVAEQIGTINYEIVCMVGKRIPREYILGGKVHQVVNYLLDSCK